MADYADLIARLESATGPDRQLDAGILSALGFELLPDSYGGWYVRDLDSEITDSIDAALALVERRLPDVESWSISVWLVAEHHNRPTGHIWNDDQDFRGHGANGAIALVVALLRALQSQESSDG